MTLLDQLQASCAAAMDAVRDIAALGGVDCDVTIVVSPVGTVEGAFTVGQHGFAELRAIVDRLEHGARVECDVTSTSVGPREFVDGGAA